MKFLPRNTFVVTLTLLFPLVFLLACENTLSTEDTSTSDILEVSDIIEGEYIVSLEIEWDGEISEEVTTKVKQKIQEILLDYDIKSDSVLGRYYNVYFGFGAILTDEQVESLTNDSRIASISKNRRLYLQN